MATIKITPEMLREKANQLRGYRTEHEGTMQRITSLVGGLSGEWTGAAQTAFLDNFNGMKPTFDNFIRILQGYEDLMNKAARELEETDRSISGSISSFQ